MYETRGPCCDHYNTVQCEVRAQVKTIGILTGGNPRLLTMHAENVKLAGDNIRYQLGLDPNPECPCHEAPNPVEFRKFFAYLMNFKGTELNPNLDTLERYAQEFVKAQEQ